MDRPTRLLAVDRDAPDESALAEAAALLRGGGLVAFATETVYGLGADATDPAAVAGIFAAKGRPAFNPLIVHADGVEMARRCVADWTDAADRLAERFWPGPLTLILPRSPLIPDIVTAGGDLVGVRVPAANVARRLIAHAGRPIAAPSANRSTGVSPTQARHVLKDLDGRIDLVLDSGPTPVGLESTVLDLSASPPRILRPGAITAEQIAAALGGVRVEESSPHATPARPVSPGQLAVHYAPRATAVRVAPDQVKMIEWPGPSALIVVGDAGMPATPDHVRLFRLPTPEIAARDLYATLHACDEQQVALIVVVPPPDRPEWRAVRDRLWRATVEAS